jgi:hypothetical protein
MAGMVKIEPSDSQQLDASYLNSVIRHAGNVRKAYPCTQTAAHCAVELPNLQGDVSFRSIGIPRRW